MWAALAVLLSLTHNIYCPLPRVGFAADAYPRYIIPSELRDPSTNTVTNLFDTKSADKFYERMLDFVQNLFFKNAFVHARERTVVIVESVFCPTRVRETIARILYMQLDVFSVLFVPAHLVALATLAVDTAVVIDLGHREATVLPVFSGVQVLNAWQAQPIAAEAVHTEIRRQLLDIGVSSELLSDEVVEDIKVRTCFVTTLERAAGFRDDDTAALRACPDVDYPVLGGGQVITVPGRLRETAFEVLFQHDNERTGLPYLVLDAILACPLDMRKPLAENLFLIGGTAMTTGLVARLKDELLALLQQPLYAKRLFVDSVKFHTAPSKANFTAWLGGSIYGGTELAQTRSFTREAYVKAGRVPDWVAVEENRSHGSK